MKRIQHHLALTAHGRHGAAGRLLLTTLFLLAFAGGARADEVELGTDDGTTNNTYLPGYNFYNYSFTQQIYTADEIGVAGTINSIAFKNTGAEKTRTYYIYMALTNKETFTSGEDWVAMSEGDLVFSGELTFTVDEWTTIVLDTPFDYDGSSNLIVSVADNSYYWSPSPHMACLVFDATSQAICAYRDANAYDITAPGVSGSVLNVKNQILLDISPSGGTVCLKPTLAVSGITHNEATITVDGGSGTYNVQYKDDSATDWTDVATNTTETTFTINGLTPLTAYDVRGQSVCDDGATSDWRTTRFTTTAVPTAVGDSWSDDFEGEYCGWELINGDLTNAWIWGEATKSGGTHALYISNDGGITNAYTIVSPTKVFAAKLLSFAEGKYEFFYDWMANGESTYDFLRVALVPGTQTLTAGTDYGSLAYSSLPNGWIALDGGSELSLATEWQTKSEAIDVSAGNYYLVFAWRNDGSGGNQPPAAIDNVSIRRMTCLADVEGLDVSDISANGATLTWTADEATQWQVAYSSSSTFENATEVIALAGSYEITGLQPATHYFAKVRAYCGDEDYGAWSEVLQFTTDCVAIDLSTTAYSENFDSYTGTTSGSTNNLPECWNYINTSVSDSDYPRVCSESSDSHSADNCLELYSHYSSSSPKSSSPTPSIIPIIRSDPQPQYAILPEMEYLAGKQITLWAKGDNDARTFKVGTMTNPADASTFVEIDEQTLTTSYQVFDYIIPADATARYIAIMIDAATSERSINHVYIDDIVVKLAPSCVRPAGLKVPASSITAHGATVTWTERGSANTWILEYADNDDFENSLSVTVEDEPTFTFQGLNPETTYYVRVKAHCGEGEESEYSKVASFTTCASYVAPADLSVTAYTTNSITLSWKEKGEATQWQICVNDDEENLIEATTTTHTLVELTEEVTYTAKVRGHANEGYTGWSDAVSFEPTAKLVIGSGTGTTDYLPTNINCNNSYTQQIYTVAELGEAGVIESIDFYMTSDSDYERDLYIYMVSTDKETFTDNTDWIAVTEADLVFSGDVNFTAQSWTTITLDEGFVYDGMHNVAIIVDDKSGVYSSSSFRSFQVELNQAHYYYEDYTHLGPINPKKDTYIVPINLSESYNELTNSKNQIRLVKSPLGDCMKPTNLKATEVGPDFATLSWTENGTAEEWVIDCNGNNVTANGNPFTLTGLDNETEYTVKVRPACDENLWSREITFTTLINNPVPTNLVATNITSSSATVSWTGYSDSYKVNLGIIGEPTSLLVANFEGESIPEGFVSDETYPWTVEEGNGGHCIKSSNVGVASSISAISATVTFTKNGTIEFDAECCGEGTAFDKCIFSIDGEEQFANGAYVSGWKHYSYEVAAGEHTFTWSYSKDSSINPTGDYFAIDNVVISLLNIIWADEPAVVSNKEYTFENLTPKTDYFVIIEAVSGENTSEASEALNFTTLGFLELADNDSEKADSEKNAALISGDDGTAKDVMLAGRTFYKNVWNTLCLPFNMTAEQVAEQLNPTKLMELDVDNKWSMVDGQWSINNSGTNQTELADDGTLYLFFTDADAISAGVPYIIKWASGDNIVNPVFSDIVISNVSPDTKAVDFEGGKFVGTYSYTQYTETDQSILFMGSNSTLYYPEPDLTSSPAKYPSIGAFRAFFQIDNPDAVRAFVLNFGEDEATGISLTPNPSPKGEGSIYTLNGMKLQGKPTKKGFYIRNGRKVVIQ